jgi:hypothetical protein
MPLEKLKDFRKRIYKWVESELEQKINITDAWKQWLEKYGTREIIPY